jgi:hypothetical protein
MSRYAKWEDLEALLDKSDAALKALAAKHPDLMVKWHVLRKRMGRHCPMARGVLKIIVMHEADNTAFIRSTTSGEWQE